MSSFYIHCKECIYKNSLPLAPDTLDSYTFLHRIHTFRVKIRPVLKKFIFISLSREDEKLILQK